MAERPSLASIGRRVWRFAAEVVRQADRGDVPTRAAAVAFYTFLAVVPALAVVVLIYGLAFDASDVVAQLDVIGRVAPREVVYLLEHEAGRLIGASPSALGLGAAGGTVVALWSASRGARALSGAIQTIRCRRGGRGIVGRYLMSLALTAAGVLALLLAIALLVTLPLLGHHLPGSLAATLSLARWLVLFLFVLLAVGALYRLACPGGGGAWITVGSLSATSLWLGGSWGFSVYVERIARYSASFGSVSTVAVFLLWLYLSAFVVLLGAVIDRVRERETA